MGCQCLPRVLIPLKYPWIIITYNSPRSSSNMVILIGLSTYKSVLPTENHSVTEAGGSFRAPLRACLNRSGFSGTCVADS